VTSGRDPVGVGGDTVIGGDVVVVEGRDAEGF
jgi:hypothetical protein